VAGETLWLVLMPLQPAPNNKRLPLIANLAIFQFNITT
jgi:hypothetical protein